LFLHGGTVILKNGKESFQNAGILNRSHRAHRNNLSTTAPRHEDPSSRGNTLVFEESKELLQSIRIFTMFCCRSQQIKPSLFCKERIRSWIAMFCFVSRAKNWAKMSEFSTELTANIGKSNCLFLVFQKLTPARHNFQFQIGQRIAWRDQDA
jgi:hypothetical protein